VVSLYREGLMLLQEGLSRGKYSLTRHRAVAARIVRTRKRLVVLEAQVEVAPVEVAAKVGDATHASQDYQAKSSRGIASAPSPRAARNCWTGTTKVSWPISPPSSPRPLRRSLHECDGS
jgi:hypothetical protein